MVVVHFSHDYSWFHRRFDVSVDYSLIDRRVFYRDSDVPCGIVYCGSKKRGRVSLELVNGDTKIHDGLLKFLGYKNVNGKKKCKRN